MSYNKIWVLDILKKLFFVYIIFLFFMTIFRVVFFSYYSKLDSFTNFSFDISKMLFLGFRIDLTVIGYIQIIPTLGIVILYYLNNDKLFRIFQNFLVYYIFALYFIVTILLFADFGFYSYFKDHLNILFFGFFEDDTVALLKTFWENYSVVPILTTFTFYLIFLFFIIKKIFKNNSENSKLIFLIKIPFIFFIFLILFNFFIIRGTFGMYPLGKMIPNVSANEYINKIEEFRR